MPLGAQPLNHFQRPYSLRITCGHVSTIAPSLFCPSLSVCRSRVFGLFARGPVKPFIYMTEMGVGWVI
jgi:hypothetical protein